MVENEENMNMMLPRIQKSLRVSRRVLSELEYALDVQKETKLLEKQFKESMDEASESLRKARQLVEEESINVRDKWLTRIYHVTDESEYLMNDYHRLMRRSNRYSAHEELLQGSYGSRTIRHRGVDALLHEQDSLRRSVQDVTAMTELGQAVFHSVREQGSIFKRIKKGTLDIATTLGISSKVASSITKRQQQDRIIVFVGIVISTLIIGAFYYFMKY